ncbi:MAG: MBL fold metallo-hydrolase [Kordiimonadaceae bacterium]|nr:MBL fold metallo-hydrolase [Kordiimonadaceae bacterium]MBT7583535.1 MBL fold metallo-hydrolase [Kordiimonadaceae bacterium]
MIVKQLYADNRLRNFHYLIACEVTKEAMVIDPLDVERCLSSAHKHGFKITTILNTHEHWDHIDGNAEMCEKTGAKIVAHHGATSKIPNVDRGLKAGDHVNIGSSISFKVLDTPGHTDSHICILSEGPSPALFCGDTLFNAGVGHCKLGGNPDTLYDTFSSQLSDLSNETRIFPGHDYMVNNLEFTIDREPDNENAKSYLNSLEKQSPHDAYISTMADERKINSFLRLQNPSIIKELQKAFPDMSKAPSEKEVFLALRELRNHW